MPDELKPLLEKVDALEKRCDSLQAENEELKKSVQKVTDLNRALLDRRVETTPRDNGEVSKKFQEFMKGE